MRPDDEVGDRPGEDHCGDPGACGRVPDPDPDLLPNIDKVLDQVIDYRLCRSVDFLAFI